MSNALTWGVHPLAALFVIFAVIAFGLMTAIQFTPGVSLGELIGIVVAVVIALISGGLMCQGAWRLRRPFKMRFCDQPEKMAFPNTYRVFRPIYEGRTGRETIHLELKTYRATEVQRFDVRFLNGLFGNQEADRNVIHIVSVSAPEWERILLEENCGIPVDIRKGGDEHGGMAIRFPQKRHWVVGQPLWVDVEVEVARRWKGRISFRAETDRRAWARRRVHFYEQ